MDAGYDQKDRACEALSLSLESLWQKAQLKRTTSLPASPLAFLAAPTASKLQLEQLKK